MEPKNHCYWKGKASSKPPFFWFHLNFPGRKALLPGFPAVDSNVLLGIACQISPAHPKVCCIAQPSSAANDKHCKCQTLHSTNRCHGTSKAWKTEWWKYHLDHLRTVPTVRVCLRVELVSKENSHKLCSESVKKICHYPGGRQDERNEQSTIDPIITSWNPQKKQKGNWKPRWRAGIFLQLLSIPPNKS